MVKWTFRLGRLVNYLNFYTGSFLGFLEDPIFAFIFLMQLFMGVRVNCFSKICFFHYFLSSEILELKDLPVGSMYDFVQVLWNN